MNISVIIPCKNESEVVENNLIKINHFFTKNKKISEFEIIIIDDGSTDNTYEIIKKLKDKLNLKIIKNPKNFGKGYSVKKGVESAKYKWLIFFDADLSTPIKEINKFLSEQKYDIVIGSRKLPNSNQKRN